VSDLQMHLESALVHPPMSLVAEDSNWYAIHTKPRHEKWIAGQLQEKRVLTFLPLLQQIHQWTDRRSKVEVPMFSCYAFVRIVQTVEERLKVLRTPGVLGFVGSEREGTPIPTEQIENLRIALREKIPCAVHPFIRVGQRVRVRGGSLNGVEGILLRQGKDQSVIVSVELLQRSIAIRVEGYEVELV
jgi:transcription termination/antitermination protein NusG